MPLRTTAFWAVYRHIERSPVMQQPVEKVRRASDFRRRMLSLPGSRLLTGVPDPSVAITDTTIPLVTGRTVTDLRLRVYRPEAAAAPLPVVLNYHGGGWVSGNPEQSEWWCAGIAARAGVVVVSVDYRLAPEHPFPAPAEDCYLATCWVAEHAAEFGVDGSRLAVMGDSAGGNLAAVVALMARDRNGPAIALQVLIYPSVELGGDYPSKHENANAPVLGRRDVDTTWRLYLHGAESERKDPYASPLFADHHGLPPALIQTAQYDPLRDEGSAYAAALRSAGVPVRLTNYAGAVHGYITLPNVTTGGRRAMAEAAGELRAAWAG